MGTTASASILEQRSKPVKDLRGVAESAEPGSEAVWRQAGFVTIMQRHP
jgi:hypothetical protein